MRSLLASVEPGGHVVCYHDHQPELSTVAAQCCSNVSEHPGPLCGVVHHLMPEAEGDGVNHQSPHPWTCLQEASHLLYCGIELCGVVRAAHVKPSKNCLELRGLELGALRCPSLRQQCTANLQVPAGHKGAFCVYVDGLCDVSLAAWPGRPELQRDLSSSAELHAELRLPRARQAAHLEDGSTGTQGITQQLSEAFARQDERLHCL
mmetsp:Transcript_55279/g.89404  ORF Transcript_55279/g.89404 Transcript_55279/m.89404 type:complete len:206 (-) Transcript_55279:153-770(-)